MITADGAGASHDLIRHLDKLAGRCGYALSYSVGWAPGEREKTALRLVPEQAWQAAWPAAMRVFARRERPHPGARLTLSGAGDGWRYSVRGTSRAAGTRGWPGQTAYIDAAHRVHARVEDVIRTGRCAAAGAAT